MRSFLLFVAIIAPVLLTVTGLGYVSAAGRRYGRAERELIGRLQLLSQQGGDYRRDLAQFKGVAEDFLTDADQDFISLARAIEFVAGIATGLSEGSAQIIIRILRHGSDYNKARYLDMLFSQVDLRPPPRPAYRRNDPNQPGPSSPAAPEFIRGPESAR